MSLTGLVPQLTVPLFTAGAGNDLVVPPHESCRLCRAASGPKQALCLENANQIAISRVPEWTANLAQPVHGIVNERRSENPTV